MVGEYDKKTEGVELAKTSQSKPQRDEKGRLLPGNTANPSGRPPGSISITAEIKKKLLEVPENQQKSYLDILVAKILKKAIQDEDFQMMKQIWSYVDGNPKNTNESFSRLDVKEIPEPELELEPEVSEEIDRTIKRIIELKEEIDKEEEERIRQAKENNNQVL